jgi:hypothetical protein
MNELLMTSKRTTHLSSKGAKPHAVRGREGRLKDVQSSKKALGQDIKRKSSIEELRESSKRFSRAMKRLAKR